MLFDPLLKTPAAMAYIQKSTAWGEKKRCTGGGPVYIKIGRSVSYRRSDLDKYIAAHERRHTSDPGGDPDDGRCGGGRGVG